MPFLSHLYYLAQDHKMATGNNSEAAKGRLRVWDFLDGIGASITASATFGHSASPDNGTCWHIMALQGAMQVYVKRFDSLYHHKPLYFHHL
jgi:hypothetical protein